MSCDKLCARSKEYEMHGNWRELKKQTNPRKRVDFDQSDFQTQVDHLPGIDRCNVTNVVTDDTSIFNI